MKVKPKETRRQGLERPWKKTDGETAEERFPAILEMEKMRATARVRVALTGISIQALAREIGMRSRRLHEFLDAAPPSPKEYELLRRWYVNQEPAPVSDQTLGLALMVHGVEREKIALVRLHLAVVTPYICGLSGSRFPTERLDDLWWRQARRQ